MSIRKLASAASFAHLLGLASAKAEDEEEKKGKSSKSEEDDDAQRADESDDDYAKRMEDKDEKEEKKGKSSKSEEDDDAQRADESDDDYAKRMEDKEEKEEKEGKEAAAVRTERARCAQIIAHGIANSCVRQAGVFAFDTDMSASKAIKAMSASTEDGSRRASSLRDRMATVQQTNVGPNGGAAADPKSPSAVASAIIEAGKRRRGEI